MQTTFNEIVGTYVAAGSTTMLGSTERAELSRELSSLTPDLEITTPQATHVQASDTALTGSACQSIFVTCKVECDEAARSPLTGLSPTCISDHGRDTAAEAGNGSDANPSNFPPYCIQ